MVSHRSGWGKAILNPEAIVFDSGLGATAILLFVLGGSHLIGSNACALVCSWGSLAPKRDSAGALGQIILPVPGMQRNGRWGLPRVCAANARLRRVTTRVRLLDGRADEGVWLAYI